MLYALIKTLGLVSILLFSWLLFYYFFLRNSFIKANDEYCISEIFLSIKILLLYGLFAFYPMLFLVLIAS